MTRATIIDSGHTVATTRSEDRVLTLQWETHVDIQSRRLIVRLCPEAEGGFSAHSPEFPGIHAEGDDFEETMNNVVEAATGVFRSYLRHEETPIRRDVTPIQEGEFDILIEIPVDVV